MFPIPKWPFFSWGWSWPLIWDDPPKFGIQTCEACQYQPSWQQCALLVASHVPWRNAWYNQWHTNDRRRKKEPNKMAPWNHGMSFNIVHLYSCLALKPPLNLKNSRIPKLCARFTPPGCGVAFDLGQVFPPKKDQKSRWSKQPSLEPRDGSFLVKWIQYDTSDSAGAGLENPKPSNSKSVHVSLNCRSWNHPTQKRNAIQIHSKFDDFGNQSDTSGPDSNAASCSSSLSWRSNLGVLPWCCKIPPAN